jgi:NitT/TauT family transport system substrate-binding protein
MIKFDADHPDQHLIDVYQVLDSTPNAIITLKRTGITQPTDLNGRKIGAPPADSSRLMFPIFAKLNHVDAKSIRWQSVAPNLRETELLEGQLDAVTGDTTTSIFNLLAAHVGRDDIVSMPFAKYGLDLYGSAVIVRSDYLKAHPDVVRAFVEGTIAGEIATIKNPDQAMQTLKNRDPLFDTSLEKARLGMTLEENILTPSVKMNGLGYVDPARMSRTIKTNSEAYGFKNTPASSEIYTTSFLPPQSQRSAPKWTAQ